MTEEYTGPERRSHVCTQETAIALMQDHISQSTAAWTRVEGKLNNGMVTQIALNRTSLVRAWWFIGALILMITGGVVRGLF